MYPVRSFLIVYYSTYKIKILHKIAIKGFLNGQSIEKSIELFYMRYNALQRGCRHIAISS